jgi:hypothetical protein
MAVTSKMAKWMSKQVKERPSQYSKKETKEAMDRIEMSRMSKKELEDTGYGGTGRRADAAIDELERREINKYREKVKDVAPYPAKKIPAPGTTEYKKITEEAKKKKLYAGGAIKKIAAKKLTPVKKPAVKNPIKKGK